MGCLQVLRRFPGDKSGPSSDLRYIRDAGVEGESVRAMRNGSYLA